MIIRLTSGETRNRLQAIGKLVDHPRELLFSSAGYVRRELQRHFAERDRTPNRLGGKRTHFWGAIRNATQMGEVTDRQAEINIADPRFAQRLYGGTITAKTPWPGSGLKLLTIPVDPRAHGRRASVFKRETGLQLIFLGGPKGGELAAFEGGPDLTTIYICKPSITQEPDPNALPPGDALEEAAKLGAEDYLATQIQADQPS